MLICHCRAVNDHTIRHVIAAGAREPEHIASVCGAGSRCGGCITALLGLLAEQSPRSSSTPVEPSAA